MTVHDGMKATPFEFRFRFLIHAIIYFLGFVAPWNYWLHLDTIRTWQLLASWPARNGWMSFSAVDDPRAPHWHCSARSRERPSAPGAPPTSGPPSFRTPPCTAKAVVAAGPYRYLRNPLYLGTFVHTFALALLMPPSGAIFCIVAIGLLQLRLILAEESFLTTKLGEPYVAYCAKVPRLIPVHHTSSPRLRHSTQLAHCLPRRDLHVGCRRLLRDPRLALQLHPLIKGVLISLGISLIVRAFIPKR